ncbi:MAG: hypothetical protein NTU83_14310 [Candidatus Hydrogenedentes bacterium]|nr:hypothetical protein [Candidatus Hydrogenedentota bacterium]
MTIRLRTLVCLAVLGLCAVSWGQAVEIGSVGSADRRVAVAIPDFAAGPGMEAAAKEMSQVAAYDLDFTGLFAIVASVSYPPAFQGFTSDPTQIDFVAWRTVKIAYRIWGSVTLEGNTIAAEMRMFDVASGTQVVGQRLTASRDLPRLVAHRFTEEVVRKVDGVPGIASTEVVFSAGKPGAKEIYVADYDGANAKQLTKHGSISILPKASPDGTKVAYISFKDRYPFLYIFERATGKSTVLSKNVGLNATPSWSPDGHSIAMVLSKDGNSEIYVKSPDGTGERRLTRDPASDSSPAYDPSGKQIAFVSDRGGTPQIYVMDADGGNPHRVSMVGGKAYDPIWSPDGKMIAFVAERSGEGLQIYVMNADGSDARRLSDSGGMHESPTWSPDSRHVMFSSSPGLWAINVLPPCEQHRINVKGMACEGPCWGPRR